MATHTVSGAYTDRDWYGQVELDGRVLDPTASQRVRNHSPDGFAWGYSGSGPSQLALAILLEVLRDERRAVRHYHAFREAFLAHLPQGPFALTVDVEAFVEAREGLVKAALDATDDE